MLHDRQQTGEATSRSDDELRALVTGGAGFIGHHLVAALVAKGHDVTVLDDLSTGMAARIEPLAPSIRFIEGSILDPIALRSAMEGRELVFHLAAIPSVARSLRDPVASNAVNVDGTIAVMLAAAEHGVARVVVAGSSSVYGIPAELPCRESMRPVPESPYGVSKLAAEQYVHAIGKHAGIHTIALRYFNVFGPGQDPASEYAAVIPRFITAVLAGERPVINGSGEISRDFTHVDNVVSANLLAATADAPAATTCNIACGERTTLMQLLRAICDAAGRHIDPVIGPARAGDIVHSLADISMASRLLGYRVVVPFQEGIRSTVSWFATSRSTTESG